MSLQDIFEKIGLVFDSELGLYVHERTKIPLTVHYDEEKYELVLLDQTKLPYEVTAWRSSSWEKVADLGIKGMIVRGSQAIGCVACYAMLLAANSLKGLEGEKFLNQLEEAGKAIKGTRPTAYPLTWAVDLVMKAAKRAVEENKKFDEVLRLIKETADFFLATDLVLNWFLRQEGKKYLKDDDVIMTHCNGGSLSSSFGGHALGMIEEAYTEGMDLTVVAKETRPRCQGYKLTVWELNRAGVPVVIVTDNMIVSSFKRCRVSKVLLGVDRVSRDGYVANKIGSSDIAHIAKVYDVPFYYATSYSTIDLDAMGEEIPIEERDIREVTHFYLLEAEHLKRLGVISEKGLDEWPPSSLLSSYKEPRRGGVVIYNPAFDLTPPELITAIITDIGSFKPENIKLLTRKKIDDLVRERLVSWGIEPPFEG